MRVGTTPAAGEERGYAMVALLILMAVMAVAMTAALPAWSTLARREREAELVFRGEQYARAIMLFQRKYAGAFPPTIDVLVTERFLRRKYKDPITDDDFQTIAVGQAVAGPQAANPFAPGQPGGTAGRSAAPASSRQSGAGGTSAQTSPRAGAPGSGSPTAGQAQGGRGVGTPGVGGVGASAGIMGVTSKSDQASFRTYKGADHYNQWLFIATQASTQAGGRGAQTPGQGVRGGAPPGAPGGRSTPPASPFGRSSPFGGRGQQSPANPGSAGPGRSR